MKPVAWALFAPNGNIRMWSTDSEAVRKVAAAEGWPLTPLYPGPVAAVAEAQPLPHWEPCNPGCDPEFNGQRSRYCAKLCQNACDALTAAGVETSDGTSLTVKQLDELARPCWSFDHRSFDYVSFARSVLHAAGVTEDQRG